MSKAVKHQLFRLIDSLSKAEKRNFKIFATRAGADANSKFIQLFDLLDRMNAPDDVAVIKRMSISNGQFSNLKRHLYQQLLTSLRLIYIKKEVDIEIREQIDFARILYGKGHYLDALRILERVRSRATEHNQDLLRFEILEFQKLIEARHITLSRQVDNKMDLLLKESAEQSQAAVNTSNLFNLNIQIHGLYIEHGHGRTEKDRSENNDFWRGLQPRIAEKGRENYTFHQRAHRYQATMWFRYIQLDFVEAQSAAMNVYTLFTLERQMTLKDPDLYLRSLYYVAMFAYLNKDLKTVSRFEDRLQKFVADENIHLNANSRRVGEVYAYLTNFNRCFLEVDVSAMNALGDEIISANARGDFRPNSHRWGLFLYKCAAARFLAGAYDKALDQLNDIINMRGGILREDLLINARLLHALCNFELGNYSLVDYHLTGLARVLRRSREAARVHHLAVSGLRRLLKTPVAEHGEVYEKLRKEITAVEDRPFEQKALSYLDLGWWLGRKK